MWDPPPNYRQIGSLPIATGNLKVWHSPMTADPVWDDFLRRTPSGQFQQSSLWAEFKATDGWHHHRVILTHESGIVGGFQILWKKKTGIRIGYVSKGPVAHPETSDSMRALAHLLAETADRLRLIALIMQAPDESGTDPSPFLEFGFQTSNPMHVVEATYLVDLNHDIETLRSRMSPSLRRNLRKAKKQPTKIRQGAENELGIFYSLMASTCLRQKTAPNPPSENAVRHLWGIFSRWNLIRLTLAECTGQMPAAKLSICFGDRMTVWKKGWDGSHNLCHPNELLEDESLEWARNQGFRVCDFCSFNRLAAERILAGASASDLHLSSRDEYHLRFGGRPQLLPRAMVLLPNFLLRWLYRHIYVRRERKRKPIIQA